ncbi:unnamed protein product [Ceutorhynchus assimilis]|uniref:Uncharacterized protein n=1 Tax=Ceutorhynchus assimilis TaxID=467358 RepID=A0A9N9MS30_9CUCU|nr:unnamed protein product [Ceutorhynchus assimilis]
MRRCLHVQCRYTLASDLKVPLPSTFRKYDYGPKGNVKLYGQTDPPHYNLSAVTAPSAFFSAPLDGMISLEDVYEAILNLPNTIYLYRIPFYRFNHIHYLFGRNASELVYEPTYQLIKKIDSGVIPPQVEVPSDYR